MVSVKLFFVPAFFIVLGIYILYNVSFLDNNDFMYAAAPLVWSQNGTLYRDVPFIQAPLIIILNFGIMKLFSAENVFIVSRALSILLVLAAVLISAFALRRVKDPRFIWLYILLCLSNSYILSNSREMGSYSQPLFLISVALALQTLTIATWKRGLFVGVAIGLATATKFNFILIAPAFLLLLLFEVEWSWGIVVWFCLGVFVGVLPLIYYIAVDFRALYKHAVRFHHLTLQARGLGVNGSPTQVLYSLLRFAELMTVPFGFVALRLVDLHPPKRWRTWAPVAGFIGCSLVMAMAPLTIYPQYLAPCALIILLFSIPDAGALSEQKNAFWIIGVTLLLIQLGSLFYTTTQLIRSQKGLAMLEVVRMQRRAEGLAATMNKCDRRLYSPEPLFLLSEDIKYPAELVSGPFLLALRGGNLKKEDYGIDIDARINEWAPTLLIYGYYANEHNNFSEIDEKMQVYAADHSFETRTLGVLDGRTVVMAYSKACSK